jgi:hypothetical protein
MVGPARQRVAFIGALSHILFASGASARRRDEQGECMNPYDLYLWKLFWGIVFAGAFLLFFFSFLKRAVKAPSVKYNWSAVVLSFSTMALALYLMFFVQM